MGELMEYLVSRKSRIEQQINQVQNFNIADAQQKITRINAMITKLQNNPSWDV